MTQAAVNNAIVLYRLPVEREDVEHADAVYFLTDVLQQTLSNPTVSSKKKSEIIARVYEGEKTPEVLVRFIQKMCELDAADEMREIFDAYYAYWDKLHQIRRADLIFSEEPTEDMRREAKQLLQTKYPEDTIETSESVDASLLGGYVIRMDGLEVDCSYEGRIRQLERILTGR